MPLADQAPRQQPEQRQCAEADERHAPIEMRDREPAEIGAERRSDQVRKADDPVGDAELVDGHVHREQFRDTREADALTESQQQAQRQHRRKSMGDAERHRRHRPYDESDHEDPARAESLGDPPDRDLNQRVGPEERGQQQAELARRQVRLRLNPVGRRRQQAAVHVIDEQNGGQQHDQPAVRRAGRVGGLGGYARQAA